jgi:hypothetical protein
MGGDRAAKQWQAVADVYPSHFTTMFVRDVGFL